MGVSINQNVNSSDIIDEVIVTTSTAIMSNGLQLFTVSGGDIQIVYLASECYTANNATASTVTYSATNARGTISITGTSPSLANAAIGTTINNALNSLTAAPTLSGVTGASVNVTSNSIRLTSGTTISLTVAVGSTTGTWKHYLKYRRIENGAIVTANF